MPTYAVEIKLRQYASRTLAENDADRKVATLVFDNDRDEINYKREDGSYAYISATALYDSTMAHKVVDTQDERVECYDVHLLQGKKISLEGEDGSYSSPEVEMKFDTTATPDSLMIRTNIAGDGIQLVSNAGPIKIRPNGDGTNGDIRLSGPVGIDRVDEHTGHTNFNLVPEEYGRIRWVPTSIPGGTITGTVTDGWFDGQWLVIENANEQDASALQLATSDASDPIDGLSIAVGRVGIIMWLNDRWVPLVEWS
jgi:hypothetical protein